MSSDLTKLADSYLGGLAHVHTRLSNYPEHFESNQTISAFVQSLINEGLAGGEESPFKYVLVTEHASNPANPHRLGQYSIRARSLKRQSWHTDVHGLPIMYGFEASLLAGGGTDLTEQLAENCEIVIASKHDLPKELEGNVEALTALLEGACRDSSVDVIGHPARGLEGVRNMDWDHVFSIAEATGTAIEVNLNNFPDPDSQPARAHFWHQWMDKLGASDASVFLGTDLHNDFQLRRFIRDWRSLEHHGHSTSLGACMAELEDSGIGPDRVVTSTYSGLREWLRIDKDARSRVLLP